MKCKWLPELMVCENWAEFSSYEENIYQVFSHDFIETHPEFEHKPVKIRWHPIVDGREQAFFHVTSKEYTSDTERCPDPKRCERIRWIRAFIENYDCDPNQCDVYCSGIKVWDEPYKMYTRVYILSEEEKYMVIVERRGTYNLLITAYYLDYPHALEKQLKKYRNYKKAKRA